METDEPLVNITARITPSMEAEIEAAGEVAARIHGGRQKKTATIRLLLRRGLDSLREWRREGQA